MSGKAIKLTAFDAADYLETPEDIAVFVNDALVTNDPRQINHALGIAARAKGMSAVARDAELGRESLYKALKEEGNPSFSTILRVFNALGIKITAQAA